MVRISGAPPGLALHHLSLLTLLGGVRVATRSRLAEGHAIVRYMKTSWTLLGIGCTLVGCGKATNLMLGGGAPPMKADTGGEITYLPEDTGEDGEGTDDTGSAPDDDTGETK